MLAKKMWYTTLCTLCIVSFMSVYADDVGLLSPTNKAILKKHNITRDIFHVLPMYCLNVIYKNITLKLGGVIAPLKVKMIPTINWHEADASKLFTIAMVDLDAPSPIHPSERAWLHWLVVNVPGNNIEKGNTIAEYVGAGPLFETGFHRYVFVVYQQKKKLDYKEPLMSNRSAKGRAHFKIDEFVKKYDLGKLIGGSFFLAEYDSYVAKVHEQLGQPFHYKNNIDPSSKTTQNNIYSNSSNPNQDICDVLNELADYERTISNKLHISIAYWNAVKLLSNLTERVKSGKEAMKIRGIGKRIANIVDEIITTGHYKFLEEVKKDKKRINVLKELTRVTGIGPAKAKSLCDQGISTIDLLKQNQHKLTHHQKIGLKYLNDFEKKIPRSEIVEVEKIIKKSLHDVDPKYKIIICGSYRRGLAFSGDIDVLITHPSYTSKTQETDLRDISMQTIMDVLKKANLITDTISAGKKKFMGVCKINKVSRRLDIRFNPFDQYYCAVLYFTGSGMFNTRMREHAVQKGFTLNEYTLRQKNSKGNLGDAFNITSEEDIFKYLDYPYKKPEDRNLSLLDYNT